MKAALCVAAALALLMVGTGCSPTAPSPEDPRGRAELTITSVSPTVGSTVMDTKVSILGAGFEYGARVSLDGQLAAAAVVDSQSISATLPARPPGVVEIVITNPNGRSVRLADAFRYKADLPNDPVPVRATGQIVNVRGGPVPRAIVRLFGTLGGTPQTITDPDGRFVVAGTLEQRNRDADIQMEVLKVGYKRRRELLDRSRSDPLILELTGPLIIRAGEAIDSGLVSGEALSCTEDGVPCVVLVVEGTTNEVIDVTVTATDGQQVGFFREQPDRAPSHFPSRLTVSPTELWILGGFGRFTLRAEVQRP